MSKTKRNDARGHERGQGAYSKGFKLNKVIYVTKPEQSTHTAESRIMDNGERNSGRAAKLDKV